MGGVDTWHSHTLPYQPRGVPGNSRMYVSMGSYRNVRRGESYESAASKRRSATFYISLLFDLSASPENTTTHTSQRIHTEVKAGTWIHHSQKKKNNGRSVEGGRAAIHKIVYALHTIKAKCHKIYIESVHLLARLWLVILFIFSFICHNMYTSKIMWN